MASGILGLLDDIAVLMDEVATMSKVATKKTIGILADDLAVNAEKASGFVSNRELPVLWKLTKGSIMNKIIILPGIFLLSAFFPVAIVPILICGGIYLSFEGALKVYESIFYKGAKKKLNPENMSEKEAAEYESKRIKSAILIDFILSIEIIIITLGIVLDEPLKVQILVVSFVAILATIGVYGIVALLVRIDDAGYSLVASSDSKFLQGLGKGLVRLLPIIIRVLNVIGTLAMILVGGGIFVHNLDFVHGLVNCIPDLLSEFLVGLVAGFTFLMTYLSIKVMFKNR